MGEPRPRSVANSADADSSTAMSSDASPRRIFLLSPANLNGVRAKQLTSPRAQFSAALKYRSPEGVPIEEAFSFMSALYFRGKIAYARRFANPPPEIGTRGIHIIAPGFGLVCDGWSLREDNMRRLRRTPVDVRRPAYRRPLVEHAEALASEIGNETSVVLLGSIATGKYVDLLWPIFGPRLVFPGCFVGIGDMSRGALMLRAAASGKELEYCTLDVPRHRPREKRHRGDDGSHKSDRDSEGQE